MTTTHELLDGQMSHGTHGCLAVEDQAPAPARDVATPTLPPPVRDKTPAPTSYAAIPIERPSAQDHATPSGHIKSDDQAPRAAGGQTSAPAKVAAMPMARSPVRDQAGQGHPTHDAHGDLALATISAPTIEEAAPIHDPSARTGIPNGQRAHDTQSVIAVGEQTSRGQRESDDHIRPAPAADGGGPRP